jgi:hypothetical protein
MTYRVFYFLLLLSVSSCSEWHESADAGICQFTKDKELHGRYSFHEKVSFKKLESNFKDSTFKDWLEFKSTYQTGDCILKFKTDEDSWSGLYGELGYAIIRDGAVKYMMVVIVS